MPPNVRYMVFGSVKWSSNQSRVRSAVVAVFGASLELFSACLCAISSARDCWPDAVEGARPNQPVSTRAITACACERGIMGNLMNDDDLPQGHCWRRRHHNPFAGCRPLLLL